MGFFQDTVVHKYLKANDANLISQAYAKFGEHFHNPRIQENIRNSKEEQYQGEFLIDLFVKVLGYTKNPNDNFNLTTEYKNIKDSKKADGAILVNGTVKAVIELKGTNTTDLGKVEEQAFGYKNNQPECIYVITSNFEKLRLYIDNAIEHIEFNLFTLNFKEFELLYLCLALENIEKNIPKKIKDESLSEEDVITKKLYKDYSIFKSELFNNIVTLNPGINPIDLFQKTQKLIDRFLFLFFAEDRSLLPPNSVRLILSDWRDLQDRDEDIGLYDRFKKYFEYLNTGYKGKRYEVFAYNGGLFKLDAILDVIKIDSDLLYKHTLKLSEYNFNSEVDVNILGHIFENSLNELDELKAQSEGEAIDRKKTRRKKDGVFYTPKYITKYIVDNTVGKLCLEKKQEIDIRDEDYVFDKKRPKKITLNLVEKLNQYKAWLLEITICDPACGSGAFLNQALDFLIKEHKYIDELQAKLLGDTLVFSDIEKSILEKNLYGVDINEESVEIAKLSLWLRTAQPNRKLNDLNNNIKCGNSLIDDQAVAGDNAFNWKKEFPEIFSDGGFDVIIGNPPWGAKFSEYEKKYCKAKYPKSTEGKIDSYRIFIEKCFELGSTSGLISLITPNTFLYNLQSYSLRKLIFNCALIYDAIELRKNVFEDAPDVVPVILSLENKPKESYSFRARVAKHNTPCMDINTNMWDIDKIIQIEELKKDKTLKINLRSNFNFNSINIKLRKLKTLGQDFNLRQGTKPYGIKAEKETELLSKTKLNETWEKAINGRNISRYFIKFENDFVQRSQELHSALPIEIINDEKIYFQRMRKISLFPRVVACYDNSQIHGLYTCSVITRKNDGKIDLNYLLCLLNSKLINLWYKYFDTDIEIKLASVSQIPIPSIPLIQQQYYIGKAKAMINLNQELNEMIKIFERSIERKFGLQEFPKKIQEWYLHSFKDFIKELSKQKIILKLNEEAEWEEYFNSERKKAIDIKSEIEKTDKEIDQMVYKLYELTEEEIRIVEES